MKGHVLSVFGYLVLQFTYRGVLLGFFFPPLFHSFCAHHELSFARVRVRVRVGCLCWFGDFAFFFLSPSYP